MARFFVVRDSGDKNRLKAPSEDVRNVSPTAIPFG